MFVGPHGTYVAMSLRQPQLTEAQDHLVSALDDAAEHVMWEWDQPDPHGIGTCGFAHITNIDGRSSFVQRAKSLADSDAVDWVSRDRRNPVRGRVAPIAIEIGSLELRLAPSHDSGYRLSVSNIAQLVGGPAHQRIDVREELHRLLLQRLRNEWGYFNERARVYSRMD